MTREELENRLAAQGKLKQDKRAEAAHRRSNAAEKQESLRRSKTMEEDTTGKSGGQIP